MESRQNAQSASFCVFGIYRYGLYNDGKGAAKFRYDELENKGDDAEDDEKRQQNANGPA